jgi:exodeoxyribonuclease-5
LLAKRFPYKPTPGQEAFFEKIGAFIVSEEFEQNRDCFLLRGYAGTGKTTLISTLIKVLPRFGYKSVLLAPTGRAAKVMSNYAKKSAQTIHRKIYRQVADPSSGSLSFQRQKNYHEDTLFIVDEASMISDEADFGGKGLLTDLIEFVFENKGNKLMLVGDTAQLPPVGRDVSPALDADFVARSFNMSVYEQELTEVMRQEESSGILANATGLRNELAVSEPVIRLNTRQFRDIFKMPQTRLEDGIQYAYSKFGRENTVILCRSNKSAVQYNQFVRRMINQSEDELDAGDVLMIKIAGAAAATLESLDEVERVARKAVANVRSMGVAVSAGSIPETGKPTFELADDEIEVGMGAHGEAGIARQKLAPADAVADALLERILPDLPFAAGDEVALVLNNLGATTMMEMLVVNLFS